MWPRDPEPRRAALARRTLRARLADLRKEDADRAESDFTFHPRSEEQLLAQATGAPEPEPLPDELADCLAGYYELGRDANGSVLAGQREAVLARHDVTDPGRAEAWEFWWSQLEDEQAIYRDELDEAAAE